MRGKVKNVVISFVLEGLVRQRKVVISTITEISIYVTFESFFGFPNH